MGVPYTQFALHPKLTAVALAASAGAGVGRFVHVGTVYSYGRPTRDRVDESHPRDPHTFKGRMRKEQEDRVLAADGRGGMRTLVLRPPDFYGPDAGQSYVRSVFDAAVLDGGKANVVGPVDTPHEFIFVPDLARAVLAASREPAAYGQAWNVAGPGSTTTRQFADRVFAAAGREPRLRPAGKTTLRLLGLFNPLLREVVEMHYLWTTPVLLDDTRLRQLLPGLRKTPYDEGIRLTLEAMRRERQKAK